MASKTAAAWLLTIILTSTALPPVFACGGGGGGGGGGCSYPLKPPRRFPPYTYPPAVIPPAAGGGVPGTVAPPSPPAKCTVDVLKLGLCLDVLGGLVHANLGKPAENVCCPVLQGLLELEAAVCLCTAIKLRVLNLDIYIPLALNVLITCGKDPPPGYLCPLN